MESVDPTEVFELVAKAAVGAAVSDAAFLLGENGVGPTAFENVADPAVGVATALYGNLAGGPATPLGSIAITSADDSTTISISMNPSSVAFLNSFLGRVLVIGGTVPTAVLPGVPQQPFGFTDVDIPGGDPKTPMLVLTLVPEPGTGTLLGLGLLRPGWGEATP